MISVEVATNDICLREMQPNDLPQVVEAHLRSFPGFFLTFLGPRFLALMYESIATDPEGAIVVASSGTVIVGFVAGVRRQGGFYRRMVGSRKWAFGLASLGALVKRPNIAPRLLRAFTRPQEAEMACTEACLMSIAVRPEFSGKGIGKNLVHAFLMEMDKRGAAAICLTTDRDNNDIVNGFYQKLGFRIGRTFTTPEGRSMNEYVISVREFLGEPDAK
jgi:ribosomal protein S18 acetylase RimI-like enzyme